MYRQKLLDGKLKSAMITSFDFILNSLCIIILSLKRYVTHAVKYTVDRDINLWSCFLLRIQIYIYPCTYGPNYEEIWEVEVKLHALTSSLHGSGEFSTWEKENCSTQGMRYRTGPKAALNEATKRRIRAPLIK